MNEIKEIPNFPGYYISREGEVYSFKHRYGLRNKPYKLKPRIGFNGYPRIGLYKEGRKYEFRLSRLVALVYIPNPMNKPYVCHIDNNPLNNHYSNLYWGTHEDNMNDKKAHIRSAGIKEYRTRKEYRMIKICINTLYNKGYSRKSIRELFHCSKSLIENCLKSDI